MREVKKAECAEKICKEKVDICIPTLNSGGTLDLCLKAIKRSLPYNRIIICDGNSSDDTLEIAKKNNCLILYESGNLGEARNRLMREVETEWFLFIDSDVIVNKKWFETLVSQIDEKTGAINGFALPKSLVSDVRKLMLFFKMKFTVRQRGFTSNTMIRTKAIEGIKLPNVKRLEDIYLQRELERRGWKWKFALSYCIHLKPPKQVLKEAFQDFLILSKEEGFLNAITRL